MLKGYEWGIEYYSVAMQMVDGVLSQSETVSFILSFASDSHRSVEVNQVSNEW